jgi:tRNA threonylcarbamoyladenosine biosynthesis protein TsaE
MALREFITRSPEETIALGRAIGACLRPPLLVLLSGDLGAGKTTLTKGIAAGLGAGSEDAVTSPTFTLVHRYDGSSRVYHVDLYRIGDLHDLETLGLEDIFSEHAIMIVEWPDRLRLAAGWPTLRVALEHADEDTRRIAIDDPTGWLATL